MDKPAFKLRVLRGPNPETSMLEIIEEVDQAEGSIVEYVQIRTDSAQFIKNACDAYVGIVKSLREVYDHGFEDGSSQRFEFSDPVVHYPQGTYNPILTKRNIQKERP